jgi:hypothetical protein
VTRQVTDKGEKIMPRDITFKVYKYDELSDKAKERAVECVSEKLNGPWWDQHNIDDITNAITYGLADALKTPGREEYGEADYPGIKGIKVEEWDMSRGQEIKVKGSLTRDNAPGLPWTDSIDSVSLNDPDYGPVRVWDADEDAPAEAVTAMKEAVENAIHAAWKAGRTEMDYHESEEYAKDWINGNQPEFTEDGNLHA